MEEFHECGVKVGRNLLHLELFMNYACALILAPVCDLRDLRATGNYVRTYVRRGGGMRLAVTTFATGTQ